MLMWSVWSDRKIYRTVVFLLTALTFSNIHVHSQVLVCRLIHESLTRGLVVGKGSAARLKI